jgi:hypothetical protein
MEQGRKSIRGIIPARERGSSPVFFATLQADGTLYVDLKKDSLDYVQRIED